MYTLKLLDLSIKDVPTVGGKSAALGELLNYSGKLNCNVPNGFCITSNAFIDFISQNQLEEKIETELKLISENMTNLESISEKIQGMVRNGKVSQKLELEIKENFEELKQKSTGRFSVAVRSSATAEDLPDASFAGLHDSYLHVETVEEVLQQIKNCYASLYNARAIKYRKEKNIKENNLSQSITIQQMIDTNEGASGVCFTIDPDSGFKNSIVINGIWGLGENLVQGLVDPDEWHVFKTNLKKYRNNNIHKKLGNKTQTLIYTKNNGNVNINTSNQKQAEFCLQDWEVEALAQQAAEIEKHFGRAMDIEWAKNSTDNQIYILQARPETVHQNKKKNSVKNYKLITKGKKLSEGKAVGRGIISGIARIIKSKEQINDFKEGEILITEFTTPEWDVLIKKSAAIITDKGGRTSHAAIVARELGTLALVGTGNATETITTGMLLTVDNSTDEIGSVYDGKSEWLEETIDLENLSFPETNIMLTLSNPNRAYEHSFLPSNGVGLLRTEFLIQHELKIHPLALLHFDKLKEHDDIKAIEKLTAGYPSKKDYFISKLQFGVAKIAAAFHPKKTIVRFSDLKSNEYAGLIGGKTFEPREENPMLGFRGAFRYYHEKYKEAFNMECEAIRRARYEMGLYNISIMIPFCRTIEEAKAVIQILKKEGLFRGDKGLKIYMMMEIPSNVLMVKEFSEYFDGFSIGSNDLTQLVLGIDRDSELASMSGNENNKAVLKMIKMGIQACIQEGKEIGLCGQAASDFPEFTDKLVEYGINSISFNPDVMLEGLNIVKRAETKKKLNKILA